MTVRERCRTFVESTRSKVQAEIGLCAHELAPFHELVGAELVAFDAEPG